jgi:hypothetical protein
VVFAEVYYEDSAVAQADKRRLDFIPVQADFFIGGAFHRPAQVKIAERGWKGD